MFIHHCTDCERRQLVFFGQVAGVSETAQGIEVAFTCWCGSEQSGVLTDLTAASTRPVRRELAAA